MMRLAVPLSLVQCVCLVACTSHQPSTSAKREANLVGKWEEVPTTKDRTLVQFEFLSDGTAIKNHKMLGKWSQLGTGTFKFIDPTRIKVELQPSWYFGVSIYELVWKDSDHVGFRAGDETVQLSRVKP